MVSFFVQTASNGEDDPNRAESSIAPATAALPVLRTTAVDNWRDLGGAL